MAIDTIGDSPAEAAASLKKKGRASKAVKRKHGIFPTMSQRDQDSFRATAIVSTAESIPAASPHQRLTNATPFEPVLTSLSCPRRRLLASATRS